MNRKCQPCTACCDGWLQIQVGDAKVYPGRPCPNSTGSGCCDYENRPTDPCKQFFCGWSLPASPLPDWMKPNNAKVIVLFDQGMWREHPIDIAVPVGKRIPPRALNWLRDFCEKNGRLLIYSEQITSNKKYSQEQKVGGFGPQEFIEEVANRVNQGLPPI